LPAVGMSSPVRYHASSPHTQAPAAASASTRLTSRAAI
jgi:hypothetical protein